MNRCRHTRLDGGRCTMPALKTCGLCFHHAHRARLRLESEPDDPTPQSPLAVRLIYMEDYHSVLYNINAVASALAEGRIDHRQSANFNRLFQTALRALRLAQQSPVNENDLVTDVVYEEENYYDPDGSAITALKPVPPPPPVPPNPTPAPPPPIPKRPEEIPFFQALAKSTELTRFLSALT